MLDKYQLEQLLSFADEGTLSAAADKLHISQPALSKSMKKIEEDLGVSLFVHNKNRLTLTPTGEYAVACARKVFEYSKEMELLVHEYDRRLHTISVASCAPMPMWMYVPTISSGNPGLSVTTELKMPAEIEADLRNNIYDIGILPFPLNLPGYTCTFWGEENLGFNLPITHPLADRKSLSFKDLDGSKMLVFSQIGFWDDIHKRNMPRTEFMFLDNREMISTISSMSDIPTFCTDISVKNNPLPQNRVAIMIDDEDAHAKFYVFERKK